MLITIVSLIVVTIVAAIATLFAVENHRESEEEKTMRIIAQAQAEAVLRYMAQAKIAAEAQAKAFEAATEEYDRIQTEWEFGFTEGTSEWTKEDQAEFEAWETEWNRATVSIDPLEIIAACKDMQSLKKARRVLVVKYHSDVNGGDDKMMALVNAAYDKKLSEIK